MIFVNEPDLNGNELKYLTECIETNWISSEGPFVKKFEHEFAKITNREYASSVSNGSVAIDIALEAVGIGKGDEVILPSFTIISPAASVVKLGAIPVLVDSDITNWNMDINEIESKITKNTKAIIVVHIYGLPVDIDPILKLAEKHKLKVIEDAAEMHGQKYKGKPCGSFGDISTFSFYPNKHITSGEGGMIVTNDEQLSNKVNSIKNLCFNSERRFLHYELGTNARFTNLQAAVGLAQLERLNVFVDRKKAMGKFYQEELKELQMIQLPNAKTDYAENIYWVFGIILDQEHPKSVDQVCKELLDLGIHTRPFFYPMHLQPVFNKMGLFNSEAYPVAEFMADNGFYIPSGLNLTLDQQKEVVEKLKIVLS